MKRSISLYCILCIIMVQPLLANDNPLLWPVGEMLTYKVKWAFLRLGTLKLTVVDTLKINNRRIYHAQINIDSNPVLFFVNQHSVFHSYFDDELNTHLYRSTEEIEGTTYNTEYRFDYADSVLFIDMTDMNDPEVQIVKQKRFHGRVLDGVSLLYYARFNSGEARNDTVAFLFAGEPNPAFLEFRGYDGVLNLNGVKNHVKTVYMEGYIPGKSVAGLSGHFKGWFYRYNHRAPVKAQLKVFIGHVNLSLESWEKCEFVFPAEGDRE